MQRVQNAAMMWIGGEGKRVFRITKSEERLGWLNMGQLAAKATIMAALKIIWEGEGLGRAGTDKLVKTDKHGMQRVKTVGEEELRKMSVCLKKLWSTRATKWQKKNKMPPTSRS